MGHSHRFDEFDEKDEKVYWLSPVWVTDNSVPGDVANKTDLRIRSASIIEEILRGTLIPADLAFWVASVVRTRSILVISTLCVKVKAIEGIQLALLLSTFIQVLRLGYILLFTAPSRE